MNIDFRIKSGSVPAIEYTNLDSDAIEGLVAPAGLSKLFRERG